MAEDRQIRKLINSKQDVMEFSGTPSKNSLSDGQIAITKSNNSQLAVYRKKFGKLWKSYMSYDGVQYVDRDIIVKNNVVYNGHLTNTHYPCFRAYQGTGTDDQVIGNTSHTLVTMDTITYDHGDNYTAGTYRFTAPVDGVYHFDARILWDDDNSWIAENRHDVAIYKNSNRVQASMVIRDAAISSQFVYNEVSCDLLLAPDDYIRVYAYHDAGSNRNTYNANSDVWTGWNGHLITAI